MNFLSFVLRIFLAVLFNVGASILFAIVCVSLGVTELPREVDTWTNILFLGGGVYLFVYPRPFSKKKLVKKILDEQEV